jgi:Transposase DDE domain
MSRELESAILATDFGMDGLRDGPSETTLDLQRVNKAIVLSHDYPALPRARRRRERWTEEDRRLYQRHRWRSEGFHGEAKTWHRLARAARRGLGNMKIQAYLTAAAINVKRLAAVLLALLILWLASRDSFAVRSSRVAPALT